MLYVALPCQSKRGYTNIIHCVHPIASRLDSSHEEDPPPPTRLECVVPVPAHYLENDVDDVCDKHRAPELVIEKVDRVCGLGRESRRHPLQKQGTRNGPEGRRGPEDDRAPEDDMSLWPQFSNGGFGFDFGRAVRIDLSVQVYDSTADIPPRALASISTHRACFIVLLVKGLGSRVDLVRGQMDEEAIGRGRSQVGQQGARHVDALRQLRVGLARLGLRYGSAVDHDVHRSEFWQPAREAEFKSVTAWVESSGDDHAEHLPLKHAARPSPEARST